MSSNQLKLGEAAADFFCSFICVVFPFFVLSLNREFTVKSSKGKCSETKWFTLKESCDVTI
jgi:hypothetical protein